MVLVRGAYRVESTSERIKAGLERVSVEERRPGRRPTLTPEQMKEYWRMYAEAQSIRRVARIMNVQGKVKHAFGLDAGSVTREGSMP